MRTLVTLTLICLITGIYAQTDTTGTPEGLDGRNLVVGVKPGKGLYADITKADSTGKEDRDTIRITTKRKIIKIITETRAFDSTTVDVEQRLKDIRRGRRNDFTYWAGLDIGVNTLIGPDGDADLDKDAEFMEIDNLKSRFFSINFMEQKLEFGSHHAGLVTGLGLEFANYHLKNNVLLAYDRDSIYGVPMESPDYRKNKLRQMGLRVPLMLEFNTKRAPLPTEDEIRSRTAKSYSRKNNVHLAFGVIGTWYFDTMYKQKYSIDGVKHKDRDKGDYLLLPYRAAATVRLGYGPVNVFAEYALTPLFQNNKGPELTPLNIGITLVGFN
ncbi:MAG: hypothetical protein WAR83_06115 [Flavobacteriales bacterium]|nr:hypothetical protein [Flavobacteriales bacterium]